MACPSCGRTYAADVRFCAHDARALVPEEQVGSANSAASTCRTCRRSFEPGMRFCPFDADELGAALPPASLQVLSLVHHDEGVGKICPCCTAATA